MWIVFRIAWNEVIEYIGRYGEGALIAGMAVGMVAFAFFSYRRDKHIVRRVLGIALFAVYCYLVIGVTFLSRNKDYVSTMNLIPFSTFHGNYRDMTYVAENVIMFIPLGVFWCLLGKGCRKLRWIVLIGFLSSLAIETLQLLTRRGMFEVDDIITNMAGAVLGYCVVCGIRRLIRLLTWEKMGG